MAITNLNYHSYFSIFTKSTSLGTFAAFNPFRSDAHTSYDYESVSSPDVQYVPSTGRIRFRAPGDYLIFACVNFTVSAADTTAVMTIEQNDAAVYTTSDLKIFSVAGPRQMVGHIIVSVSKGDSVRVRIDADDTPARTISAAAGSHFMVIKANGLYSNAFYAADSLDQTDNDYDLFDTAGSNNEGGQVNSKTNGVAYDTDVGKFTPSSTRKFLILSTQHYENSAGRTDLEHRIKLGGDSSEVVDYGVHASIDPLTHTIGYALSVPDDSFIRVNNTQEGEDGDTYKILKGTCLTLFDISNGGTDPSSFLSISTTKATNTLSDSSGDKDVFNQSNYGSSTITKTDRLTATGTTYTPADGKFTVSKAGTYLFLLNLAMIPTSAVATTPTIKINKNGSSYYTAPAQLQGQIKPIGWTAMFLIDLKVGDYLNIIINDLGGNLDAHGSSVTMVKIDETGDSREVFAQQDSSGSVGDNYTLKTFDREVAGFQSDNLLNHQVPFSKAIAGPRNLRGRTTAYAPSLGGKTKK